MTRYFSDIPKVAKFAK